MSISSAERMEKFRTLSEKFSLVRMRGKRPIEKRWTEFCLKKRKFEEICFQPGDNAGIACGPASGILVLDVDDKEKFLSALEKNGWTLPKTYSVLTGNGGVHYYFKYPNNGRNYGNKAFKEWGSDVKGNGGVVVAPFSIHPDTNKEYTVLSRLPVSPAPKWVLDQYSDIPEEKCSSIINNVRVDKIDADALSISDRIKRIIKDGKPKGERSEALMSVIHALIAAGIEDKDIEDIIANNPIGEKYHEKGHSKDNWLHDRIKKAKDFQKKNASKKKSQEPAIFTAYELQNMDVQEPDWIIPYLLPLGVTVLAGPPKAGKTRLATDIALGVSKGNKILNHYNVNQFGVLFLCLEDNLKRLSDRILTMFGESVWPMNLYLSLNWDIMDKGGLDNLNYSIQRYPDIHLVIIDVFVKFTGEETGQKGYERDYAVVSKMKELADLHSIAIILVYHTTKLRETDDPFNKIRGTTGVTGACDTIWLLERKDRAGSKGVLHVAGRDVEADKIYIRWNRDIGTWYISGDAYSWDLSPERDEIYAVLEKAGKPMSVKEIKNALPEKHPDTLRVLLRKMINDYQISQHKRGIYSI